MASALRRSLPVFEHPVIAVRQQPDDVTCGPTCLQGLYDFHGLTLTLDDVIASVRRVGHGGTLAVLLGLDALARGFEATIYSYNLEVFDPTWFDDEDRDLRALLARQAEVKREPRMAAAAQAYMEFLEAGGEIRHEEMTPDLLGEVVRNGAPPIVGLSATYLYGCQREVYEEGAAAYDDIRGEPVGHFVVVTGVGEGNGRFRIADPSTDNPRHGSGTYWVSAHRLMGALLLGVTTFDGNLLVVGDRRPAR